MAMLSPSPKDEGYVFISVSMSAFLFACLLTIIRKQKTHERICMKFSGQVRHGIRNILKYFGLDCLTPDLTFTAIKFGAAEVCALGVLLVASSFPRRPSCMHVGSKPFCLHQINNFMPACTALGRYAFEQIIPQHAIICNDSIKSSKVFIYLTLFVLVYLMTYAV